jgi:hypothetical protein
MDTLKMFKEMMGSDIIEKAHKINKSLHLVTDFISTHPQFLFQLREYAEKTGRIAEYQTLIEMLISLMEERKQKEGKNG